MSTSSVASSASLSMSQLSSSSIASSTQISSSSSSASSSALKLLHLASCLSLALSLSAHLACTASLVVALHLRGQLTALALAVTTCARQSIRYFVILNHSLERFCDHLGTLLLLLWIVRLPALKTHHVLELYSTKLQQTIPRLMIFTVLSDTRSHSPLDIPSSSNFSRFQHPLFLLRVLIWLCH